MSSDELLEKILLNPTKKNIEKNVSSVQHLENFIDTVLLYWDIYSFFKNKEGIELMLKISDSICKIFPDSPHLFKITFKKAEYNSEKGDLKKSLKLYLSALKKSDDFENLFYKAQAYSKLGHFFKKNATFPPILKKFEKEFAKFNSFSEGMYDKAFEYFSKANELFVESNHRYNSAITLFNRAILKYNLGNLDESYLDAVSARETGEELKINSLLAEIFLHMANIHCDKEEYYMAKIYYRSAFDFFKADNNYLRASDIMHKIAWLFGKEKNMPRSEYCYKQAIEMKTLIDYKQALGEFYFLRGIIAYSLESYDKAEKCFQKASFIFRGIKIYDKDLLSKFYIFKIHKKVDSNFDFGLYNFVSAYKAPVFRDIVKASCDISYFFRNRDSETNFEPSFVPKKNFCVTRDKLAPLMRDMAIVSSLNGNREKSLFFKEQANIIFESI